ncbi:MAG: ATP-binding cassette domain-containing protein [Actinomycetota bacterium]|nr:ATP-binding cassette domain-containing protein [Actinomycetota bacterium]
MKGRPEPSAAALSVRGLAVAFGPVEVCAGIDLELPEGSVGALVGTNGAGKSSILRALAGVIPSRGSIRLGGEEISGLPPRARVGRGLVLAAGGRGTFSTLTVEESLALGARQRHGPKGAVAAVEEALTLFPLLASRRRQRTGTLSAGEQQLVTLARAVVARPRVLLVDELTLGLSATVAEDVGRVVAGRGNVVLVDQSITRALGLASWAWFLARGAIGFSGPAADLAGRRDLLQPVLLG